MANNNDLFAILLAGIDVEKSAQIVNEQMKSSSFSDKLKNIALAFDIDMSSFKEMQKMFDNLKYNVSDLQKELVQLSSSLGNLKNQGVSKEQLISGEEIMSTFREARPDAVDIEVKKREINAVTDEVEKMTIAFKDSIGTSYEWNVTLNDVLNARNRVKSLDQTNQKLREFEKNLKNLSTQHREIARIESVQGVTAETEQKRLDITNQARQRQLLLYSQLTESFNAGQISQEQYQLSVEKLENSLQSFEQQNIKVMQNLSDTQSFKDAQNSLKEYKAILDEILSLEVKSSVEGEGFSLTDRDRLDYLREESELLTQTFEKYPALTEAAIEYLEKTTKEQEFNLGQEEIKAAEKNGRELLKVELELVKAREELAKSDITFTSDFDKEVLKNRESELSSLRDSLKEKEKNFQRTMQGAEAVAKSQEENSKRVIQAEKESTARIAELNRQKEESYKNLLGKQVKPETTYDIGAIAKSSKTSDEELQKLAKTLYGTNATVKKVGKTVKDEFGNSFKEVIFTVDKTARTLEHVTTRIDLTDNAIGELSTTTANNVNKMESFNQKLAHAAEKMATWGIAAKVLYGTLNQIRQGISFITELDKDITQVAIVTGKTRSEVKSLAQEYNNLAEELGKTTKQVSEINTELVRQGLSLSEAQARMETIMKLSSAGMVGYEDSLRIITAAVNALETNHERAANVMLRVSNLSASSVEQLGEAFTKTASSAQAAGLSIEETTGILATMLEVTQEGPSQLGTSLKTILARMGRVNEETGELNENLNDIQTAMESVGTAFINANGQIRESYDVFSDLSEIWDNLDKNQRAYLATTTAGVRMQNRFFAIMENFKRVEALTEAAKDSVGFLDRAFITYTSSVEAANNRLTSSFEKLWINTIDSDTLANLANLATSAVKAVDALGGLNVALSVVGIGIAKKLDFIDPLRKSLIEIGKGFSKFKENIKVVKKDIETYGDVVAKQSIKATFGLKGVGTQATITSTAVKGLGNAFKTMLPYLAITAGITLISKAVEHFSEKSRKAKEEIAELNNKTTELVQNFSYHEKRVEILAEEYEILARKVREAGTSAKNALTVDEFENFNSLHEELLSIIPTLTTQTDRFGNEFILLGGAYGSTTEKLKEYTKAQQDAYKARVLPETFKESRREMDKIKKEITFAESLLMQADPAAVAAGQYDHLVLLMEVAKRSLADIAAEQTSSILVIDETLTDFGKQLAFTQAGMELLGDVGSRSWQEQQGEIHRLEKGALQLIKTIEDAESLDFELNVKSSEEEINKLNSLLKEGEITFEEYEKSLQEWEENQVGALDTFIDFLEVHAESSEFAQPVIDYLNEYIQYLKSLKREQKDSIDYEQQRAKELSKSLQEQTNKIKTLEGVIEKANKGYLKTVEGMAEILSLYPELSEYMDDEAVLLEKLVEKHAEEIRSAKEAAASKAVLSSETVKKMAEDYGIDLKNFSNSAKLKEVIEDYLSINLGKINDDRVEELAKKYGVDLKNFTDAAQKKAEVEIAIQKSLGLRKQDGYLEGATIEQAQRELRELRIRNLTGKYKTEIEELESFVGTANKSILETEAKDLFDAIRQIEESYEIALPGTTGGSGGSSKTQIQKLEDFYKNKLDFSKQYIEDRKFYDDWGVDNEIAAWERIKDYTEKYYADGIISYETYIKEIREINKSLFTAYDEAFKVRYQHSRAWIEDRNFYGDWTAYGDNEVEALKRVMAYTQEYYDKGILSAREYTNTLKSLQKDLYTSQKNAIEAFYKGAQEAALKQLESEKKALEENLKRSDDYYNKKIQRIRDEITATNELKEREDKLLSIEKARLELAKTEEQKAARIYKEGEGFIWEADKKSLSKAQTDLDKLLSDWDAYQKKLDLEAQIKAFENAKERNQKTINAQIENLNKLSDAWSTSLDLKNDIYSYQGDLKTLVGLESASFEGRMKLLNKFVREYNSTVSNMTEPSASTPTRSSGWSVGWDDDQTTAAKAPYHPDAPAWLYTGSGYGSSGSGAVSNTEHQQHLSDLQDIKDFFSDPNWGASYSKGGTADFTGFAKLHGTPSSAETIFNAKDSKKLYEVVHNTPDLSSQLIKNFTKNLSSVPVKKQPQPLTLSIGDINLHEVKSVEGLSRAIVTRLPNQILQDLYK